MQDRFEDMRTFVAVVQAESFGRAAERLGIVKSAVSRRVRELEGRLGVTLLNRTSRAFHLTDSGSAYYESCVGVLDALAEAEDSAALTTAELAGRIRISAPMSFGVHCLTRALRAFQAEHPRIAIELDLDDRIIDVVREGFDVAVRISHLKDSGLIARRIAAIRSVACASPDYLRRAGTPVTVAELSRHAGLVYSNVDARAYWQFRDPDSGSAIHADVPSVMRINNGDALREAAIDGGGIALLPTFIVHRAVAAGQLQVILSRFERPPVPLFAVYATGRHLPARVRGLVDRLVTRFGPEPYWDRDIGTG